MPKRVGIYVAHEDDSILGVGGKIIQHVDNGDQVFVVVFADGSKSHELVLGIEQNPSPQEVTQKRRKEFGKAAQILCVYSVSLNLPDAEGMVWQNDKSVLSEVAEITSSLRPGLIYFHYPDAHVDHRAVASIMEKVLCKFDSIEAYQFPIWTKDLAAGRPHEIDINQVPEIPADVVRVDITSQLGKKREALFEMKSQTSVWSYLDWQVQEKPILDKRFLDYFLRGEEIFIRWRP